MCKCAHPGCELSVWEHDNNYCIFHTKDEKSILENVSDNDLNTIVRTYLSNAKNPNLMVEEETELKFVGLEIKGRLLRAMINNVRRKASFIRCKIEEDYFINNAFSFMVTFEDCIYSLEEKLSTRLVIKSHFNSGVRFKIRDNIDLVFTKCQLRERVVIDGVLNPEKCSVSIVSPIDYGRKRIEISSVPNLFIDKWHREMEEATVWIRANNVDIRDSMFWGELDVDLSIASSVEIEDVGLGKRLVLRTDNSAEPPTPKIFMKNVTALNKVDSQRLLFRNLNLSRLESPDLMFDKKVIFDNVRFERKGARSVFLEESELKKLSLSWKRFKENAVKYRTLQSRYRSLKKYFDELGNHRLGNSFYAGELYAQWKAEIREGSWLSALWKRFMSSDAWYSRISSFGQSFIRPALLIFIVFLGCWILYSYIGINHQDLVTKKLIIVSPDWSERIGQGFAFAFRAFALWFKPAGRSVLIPANNWGWVAAFFQTTFTIIAGSFFILAFRRRFKR